MTLPNWVRPEWAERTAAMMSRQPPAQSESWGTILAHAQAILEHYADTPEPAHPDPRQSERRKDLIHAAHILNLAATPNGLAAAEDRRTAAILAACAFGISGTPESATATIREHKLLTSELTQGELTALALISPSSIGEILPKLHRESTCRRCIENTDSFLANRRDTDLGNARIALQQATEQEQDPWDSYLLRLSQLAITHLTRTPAPGTTEDNQDGF